MKREQRKAVVTSLEGLYDTRRGQPSLARKGLLTSEEGSYHKPGRVF